MSSLLRRLKPKETDSIDGINGAPQLSSTGSKDACEKTEEDTGDLTARNIQEVEINRKLKTFEKAHRWDPNLDDDQLEEIDEAVNARDPNLEGGLYGEVFENSPYPEVSLLFDSKCYH